MPSSVAINVHAIRNTTPSRLYILLVVYFIRVWYAKSKANRELVAEKEVCKNVRFMFFSLYVHHET